jgi:hypothetical protein
MKRYAKIMLRDILVAIGAGLASTILFLSLVFGTKMGFLPAYFAPLPLLLIGLNKGIRPATIATIFGCFSALIVANIFQAMLFGISVAIPALLIVRYTTMAKKVADGVVEWLSIGDTLARLATLGGIILITTVTYFDTTGSIAKSTEVFLEKVITASLHFSAPIDQQKLVEHLVPLFPAMVVSSWILMTLINSLFSQAILIKLAKNLRPPVRYSEITLPEWLYWLIIFSGSVALLSTGDIEYIARNLTFILAIPFFLIGLTVFHTFASLFRSPAFVLVAFYLFVTISIWAIFLVAITGFLEEWSQLRRKSRLAQNKRQNKSDKDLKQ